MEESGVEYLDLCSHLRDVGFDTTDGLHYQKGTFLEIWNEINTYLASRPAGWREGEAPAAKTANTAEAQAGEAAALDTDTGAYSGRLCLQPTDAEAATAVQDITTAQAGGA